MAATELFWILFGVYLFEETKITTLPVELSKTDAII